MNFGITADSPYTHNKYIITKLKIFALFTSRKQTTCPVQYKSLSYLVGQDYWSNKNISNSLTT
jgi:hypothetical protein